MAYERIQPFERRRADVRHAILCQLIAAVHGNENMTIQDFMPEFGVRREATGAELAAKIGNVFGSLG